MLGVFAVINPVFLSPQNIADVTRNASFTFVAAVGASFVFAAGGLDLSVGSLFGSERSPEGWSSSTRACRSPSASSPGSSPPPASAS